MALVLITRWMIRAVVVLGLWYGLHQHTWQPLLCFLGSFIGSSLVSLLLGGVPLREWRHFPRFFVRLLFW